MISKRDRSVTNPDVDVYRISIEPGHKYSNWITTTREKLRERERKIMKRRIAIVQNIVNNEIEIFQNTIINVHAPNINVLINPLHYNNIMFQQYNSFQICLNKLNILLNEWKGVNLNRSKREFSSFREYFSVGRSWFDQRKKSVLALYLWITAFNLISTVCTFISKSFTDQSAQLQLQCQKCLLFRITIKIFESKWPCPGSRPHPLLSTSIFRNSLPFQQYMTKHIDKSLSVEKYLKPLGNKKIGTKVISDLVINNLHIISNKTEPQFIECLKKLKTDTCVYLHAEGTIVDLGFPPISCLGFI